VNPDKRSRNTDQQHHRNDGKLGQVMEYLAGFAQPHVLVMTHDHRPLAVFDTIYDMEDGGIRRKSEMPN
jgi:hypothetical protein